MKTILLAALAAGAALTAATPALAAQGCGPYGHRDYAGFCRPNRGPVGPAIVAPGLRIGVFYPGHGYWDGARYWGHRYWHHGWRYR